LFIAPGCETVKKLNISPLAPKLFPELGNITGVRLSAVEAGIKYHGRDDLILVVFDPGTTVAGVFTKSLTAGASVLCCRQHLDSSEPRALIVTSGNSNTFTGRLGESHVEQICQAVAKAVKCEASNVFIASTGVIGEPLPIEKITSSINGLVRNLSDSHWETAARAILTTDTFPKGASVSTKINGQPTRITGFAKGSGMIEPNMATMLAFLFTDANIPRSVLQTLLVEQNEVSFNAITVDSDTSTSDTCLLFATGKVHNKSPEHVEDSDIQEFRLALNNVMTDLATQIIRDGEGATKLITVIVSGAESNKAAKIIAKSIANSPLVKTAIAGEDANWGRVVMAIGKSGEKVDRDKLKIRMGGILITKNGQVVDNYDETMVAKYLKAQRILLEVNLGVGKGYATIWTCDLTHDYIAINTDYRS